MNRLRKTLVIATLFLCVHNIDAQDCKKSELSPQGLEHLNRAEAYLELFSQGTEKQIVAEFEAILQTDSLWCPEQVYSKLGLLCEYIAEHKDVSYYSKAIRYYKKYNSLVPNNEIMGKITQLETKKEVIQKSLGAEAVKSGVKFEMVFVEGMLNEDTTDCIHSFYIGKHELTQEQWQSVMKNNPSHFKGPNCPVEQICDKYDLFLKELNRITGANYRLPTSIEWFYAARGGKFMENYTYSGSFAENKVAWFSSNSGDRTHEVGEKEPNSLGLYDMSGNVSELVYVDEPKTKQYRVFPVGGNYRSAAFDIMDDKNVSSTMNYIAGEGESSHTIERRKNSQGFYQDYRVPKTISSHIGIRLVQDADISSMSAEERQWDSLIKQKEDRLQKEKEKENERERKRAKRRDLFWGVGDVRWGIKFDYNFHGYGQIERDDVFVNKLFSHTMFGLNFRIPIGNFFYLEPQIKAGIESDWKTISEQNSFFDQLSVCFDDIQIVHLEFPLIVGGLYQTDEIAIRGYTAGQFCPVIQTKTNTNTNNLDINTKPYLALLFGLGFDLGNSLTVDLYFRKPITNENHLTTQGFTASIGLIF